MSLLTRLSLPGAARSLSVAVPSSAAVEIVYWCVLAFQLQLRLSIPYKWDLYVDPNRSGRPLELHGAAVADLNGAFDRVRLYSRLGDIYVLLHGLNGGFMLCRLMRLCHFQKHLGIVTRTLAAAASDLVRTRVHTD